MKKEIQLVIFDMDGLLIDSERLMWAHNAEILINNYGFKYDLNYHRQLMGASLDIYKEKISNYYGKDFPFEEYMKQLFEMNEQAIANKEVPFMKGAKEILEYLTKNNIEITIATSTKKDMAHRMMKSTGLDKYFTTITTGDEIENGKPYPDIYLKALSKYNVKKENTIVLEDGHSGFRAAYAAGLDCIIVEDLAIITDEDRKDAFKVVHSLLEAIEIIKENNIK